MFDLDQAIASWRSQLLRGDSLSNVEIDELESHLRDAMGDVTASTLSEKEVFKIAVERVGSPADLSSEFAKINEGRNWSRKVIGASAVLLVVTLFAWALYAPLPKNEAVALLRVHRIEHLAGAYESRQQNAITEITDPALIQEVVATFNDAEQKAIAERALSELQLNYPGNSELLRIGAFHRKPESEITIRALDLLTSRFAASSEERITVVQPTTIPDQSDVKTIRVQFVFILLAILAFIIACFGLAIFLFKIILKSIAQAVHAAQL